jgi:hypothetical protein
MGPTRFFARSASGARSICDRCRVEELCFWFAMANEERAGYRYGVWGRTTPAVREQIAVIVGRGYAVRRLRALLVEQGRTGQVP